MLTLTLIDVIISRLSIGIQDGCPGVNVQWDCPDPSLRLLIHAPEIGAIRLNSTPDFGASFSCLTWFFVHDF